MMSVYSEMFKVLQDRKQNPQEGSYTCYLYENGLDKILKKIGEECAETIIAAKNGDNAATIEEICDLLYHLQVMMVECGIDLAHVDNVLIQRTAKIGNLKKMKKTDKLT